MMRYKESIQTYTLRPYRPHHPWYLCIMTSSSYSSFFYLTLIRQEGSKAKEADSFQSTDRAEYFQFCFVENTLARCVMKLWTHTLRISKTIS